MTDFSLYSAFLIGLAGGVHCFGMCGGITLAMRAASPVNKPHLPFAFCYHIGRIMSYSLAGAVTGYLGATLSTASVSTAIIFQWFSIVMLILMALYIGQWYRALVIIEKLGHRVWKHISPLSKRFIPFRHPVYALPYGLIWGWLPCGLVYSTLSWSLAADSAFQGAKIMLCFGIGTLPNMLVASMAADKIAHIYTHQYTRQLIALLLLAYAGTLVAKRFV